MSEWMITTLRAQSEEIAREGHAGWGNTMSAAADAIAEKDAEIAAFEKVCDRLILSSVGYNIQRDKALEEYASLRQQLEQARAALNSIAANTCCDTCQEAALVARAAIDKSPALGNATGDV